MAYEILVIQVFEWHAKTQLDCSQLFTSIPCHHHLEIVLMIGEVWGEVALEQSKIRDARE